jgi:hypothetical protein
MQAGDQIVFYASNANVDVTINGGITQDRGWEEFDQMDEVTFTHGNSTTSAPEVQFRGPEGYIHDIGEVPANAIGSIGDVPTEAVGSLGEV